MASRVSSGLAGAALYTIIGYQVYMLTRDPLALGLLGLVEAIPALTLSLVGGHVADRMNRKPLSMITFAVEVVCLLLLAWFAQAPEQFGVLAIYAVVFLLGIGAGFSRPAFSSFVQQAIPEGEVTRVMPWLSSAALAASIAGAPLAGFAIDWIGVPTTYVVTASLFALTMVWVALIPRQPTPVPEKAEESFWPAWALSFDRSRWWAPWRWIFLPCSLAALWRSCLPSPPIFCMWGPRGWAGCARRRPWAPCW
jgi:MFS family permease